MSQLLPVMPFLWRFFCHITARPFLCQILFPSPFWCHCESSLTMSHIKWVIPKHIPISPHRKYSPRHRSLIISSSVNPSYESSLWVNYFWEMNNEPEVVMSSSPISKCQQSKTQSSTSSSTKKLTLVVDKTRFICNALIFNQHPNTLLGKMFSPHLLNRQGKFILFVVPQNSKKKFVRFFYQKLMGWLIKLFSMRIRTAEW